MNEGNGKWRRSEYISIGTLVLLASWIFYAGAKASAWDQAVKAINDLKPQVNLHSEQLAGIRESLDDIKEDVRYLRRHYK